MATKIDNWVVDVREIAEIIAIQSSAGTVLVTELSALPLSNRQHLRSLATLLASVPNT
jgi:hypothetical protein